jgi:hypothetical protein
LVHVLVSARKCWGYAEAHQRGLPGCSTHKSKFKKYRFLDILSTFPVFHPSVEDQPMKSADDWYSRMFKNKIKTENVLDEIKKAKTLDTVIYNR